MKATLWKLDLQAAQKVVKEAKVLKYFSMHAQPVKTWKLHRAQTWSVSWGAAGGAAGDAAWGAAWDAALLARCKLARLKGKHLKHAEARWDVWRRGYALRCDVNGVLYAYCLNKKPAKDGRPSRSLAAPKSRDSHQRSRVVEAKT